MKRLGIVLAAAAALLLAAPALAAAPPGHGLVSGIGYHATACTGALDYAGDDLVLVPGAGNTFWVNGRHLAIQQAVIDWDAVGLPDETYTFGVRKGKIDEPVVCTGHFTEYGGYTVTSTSILVP
jgi:hypothetical protein